MDMEKLKKINELTAELKKHRAILPSDDLVGQAEEMVIDKDDSGLPTTHTSHEDPSKGNQSGEALRDTAQPQQDASVRAAELIVKEANKAVRAELDLLRKGLLQLNDEFKAFRKDLQGELSSLHRAIAQAAEASAAKETAVQKGMSVEKAPTENIAAGKKEEKKDDRSIDRNGYAPSDVSVDKMFYFGKK
ncbi:MAG: hypothetical protein GXP63_04380 [DPANN group archaeon]|nr:hypothetical protein [DPANN group archaeon]